MIRLTNTDVIGFDHAIRGMRNPMNSWDRSDSDCDEIGKNDLDLMMKLSSNGPVHRKFMRMITVYVDITAPLYWWKEFDTYKVGTVANSCSTMHKIHEKEFTLDDFSHEHLKNDALNILQATINILNNKRDHYVDYDNFAKWGSNTTPKKDIWWQMIQLLPSSYNQKRTIMMNYEVLANIYKYRKDHKLDEWRDLCEWIEDLPYSEIITGKEEFNKAIMDNINEVGNVNLLTKDEVLKTLSYQWQNFWKEIAERVNAYGMFCEQQDSDENKKED